ncbi:MAG: T9SS type A sorting domain-containing protein [Saprospiraceae bacterium]|nr:T9SS type A sorting domain-containing protein [Saprospiraceae bacterium]
MKRIITSILMMGMVTLLTAQSILNVNGNVFQADGSPAAGVFIGLALTDADEIEFTETNDIGFYEFNIEIGDDVAEGCFELLFIDCNFEAINISDCFDANNLNFTYDFDYCADGTDDCVSFIVPEYQDSSIVLTLISFGQAPYTYEWSDGSTASTLVLPITAEGVYCVVVTDANECVFETCFDLTPPDPCFVNIFEEYNFDSVILFAEGYGGTDEVTYLWSTGETTQNISVTESGEYCVTLTDGLDCESVDCRYIVVDTTWFEECFSFIYSGVNDAGDEFLGVESFGTAPYTYVWSFGDEVIGTEQTILPAEVGVYCVVVTDAEGCVSESCYDYFVWEDCGVWIACDPYEGGVQLFAFGYGEGEITYEWSNGDVGPELFVTESGTYCVTITDEEGCTSSQCLDVDVEGVVDCFTPIVVTEYDSYVELTLDLPADGFYETIWSTGETTNTINVEESGTYCVDVFEVETGCFFTTCATVWVGGQDECWGYIETEYLEDSTALLSVIVYDNSSDVPAFSYEWSTGESTETIEVSMEGTYCVTVTSGDDCVFETCTDIVFWDFPWENALFGFVYDSETGDVLDATVDLYSVLDDGTLELVSEGNETFEFGLFTIEDLAQGNYIALANVEGGEYVPTYGFSTTSWEEAEVYQIGDNAAVVAVEIAMLPVTSLQGSGSIEGAVSTENLTANEKDTETRSGSPLVGANIMLMHSQIPVGHMYTDDNGSYFFSGLPFGTYEVVLEIPGQPRKVIEVTLSEENPNATGIEFEAEGSSTSTNNIVALSSLTLSPNPTSHTLVITSQFESTRNVTYRVIDMSGKTISSSKQDVVVGKNETIMDVSTMQSGVYYLVVQTDEGIETERFIKI